MNIMSITKKVVKWHGQMELLYISPNQNQIPTLGLKKTLDPKKKANKVNLWGCAHA
jgi:hypothetical protein